MPLIRRALLAGLALAVAVPAGMIWREEWRPLTGPEITQRVAALMRYGAVQVPHDLAGADHPEAALMTQVAAGKVLTKAESQRYRLAIQGVLADNQRMFGLLDNNIVFASDVGPDDPNNCGSMGIAGRHDHHAASAASNFAEMEASLVALETAGPLGRIRHANRAYKSLTDLMVHLAPAQASVILANSPTLPEGADPSRAALFEAFRTAMTEAGFAAIGSVEHGAALTRARQAFAGLALAVQARVTARLSPLEQRLAGRWLSIQSVSPRLELTAP